MKTHAQLILSLIFLLGFGNLISAQGIVPIRKAVSKAHYQIEQTDTGPLFEQVENFGSVGLTCQDFIEFPSFSCQAADDFLIPDGQTWFINEIHIPGFYSPDGGPVELLNFFIYQNDPETNGPGNELMVIPNFGINPSPDGNLMLFFDDPLMLDQGHYWLSVQPVMAAQDFGQWYWWTQQPPTIEQEFNWRNPGGGFEIPNTADWQQGSQIQFDPPFTEFNLSFAIFGDALGVVPPQNFSLRIGDYHNPEQWHDWIGGENDITHVQLFADDPDSQIQYVAFAWSADGELWNDFYFDFDGAAAIENSTDPSDPTLDGWSGYLPHLILPQSDFEIFILAQITTMEGEIIDFVNSTMYDPTPPSGIQINVEDFMIITDDEILLDIDPGTCTDLFEVEVEVVEKPEYFNKGIPGIQQPTNVTCAPTAAAACLKWFEGQGDTEVTGGLTNSALVDSLKKYCGTTATGTSVPNLVKGIKKWLENHGDGYTIRGPLDFDWKQLRNELEKGQNVLLGIYGTDVAHRMTFNSIKNIPEENGTIRIDFMDPWTGEEEYGYVNPETGELTGFTSTLLNSGTLKKAVIICPKETSALPGTGAVLPGPDPEPHAIELPATGLYFLRIKALDQSGNAASIDLVLDRQQSQLQPSEDGFLRIGDWNIAEQWHNWIGGPTRTTQLQVFGYSDYPVEQVSFSFLSDDEWVPFYTDDDGYEQTENTTGTGLDNGDGWSGYFAHELIEQENQILFFKADIILGTGEIFELINSINYDATPPDAFSTNLEDFMIITDDVILLDIDPGNTNIQTVEIELVEKPEEFNKGVPGIEQPTGVTCAPTAAAACLKWFEGQGDTDITGGLTNGALIDSLKKYCKTDADGTLPSDLANGIKKWIEGHGDGYTIRGPLPFDWEQMRNELERGQDVLSGIAWTGGGGHRMTFNSIKNRAEEDGKIRVDFMDPWTGQEEWGYLDTETGELTGFSSTSGDSGKLKGIIIICPKETTALPGTGTTIPGPNPPPLSIPVPDLGLYFLRINVLDQDGNTSRLDLVMDRQLQPPDDAFLRIGDWGIAEDWHNWIGGAGKTTHVQLMGYSDYPVEEVTFSYLLNDDWTPFFTDDDGFELPMNTTGTGLIDGDGWSGYFAHEQIPQENMDLWFMAEVLLSSGETFTHFNNIKFDATPPDEFLINLEDFMIINEDVILLDIDPGNTNIQSVEISLVEKPEEFNKGVPDITQPTGTTCAPAAAAACLKWFEGQGDTDITGGLSNDALIDSLKKYCKTDVYVDGTYASDWFNGLKKWIESHGNGYTIRGPLGFNWKQMRNELERGQDVLTFIHWTGGGAHATTFNSIKNRPEPDGKIRVDFMDPWTGQQEWGYLDPSTGELTGYTSTAGNSGKLGNIIIICPKETTALPGTGTTIPGPNPPPLSIPVPDPGLYFLRINVLDQDGNTSRLDLVMDRVVIPLQQTIELPAGWSGISSYLIPEDPILESIFGDVENDLTILYNFDGFYWPGENINSLGNWNPNSGYAIKMQSAALLTFVGNHNPDIDVQLNNHVSLLHIPTECGISTIDLLLQLGDNLIMVQEVATSRVFLPGYGIDQIGQLMPGKAYYITISNPPGFIVFPECGIVLGQEVKDQPLEIQSPWGKVKSTHASHQIVFSGDAMKNFDKDDIIGIFDQQGTLVGFTKADNGSSVSVSAFADDQYTAVKDGMIMDEPFNFKVYKSSQEISYRLLPEYGTALPNQETFVNFGLSEVTGFKLEPIAVDEYSESNFRIYPNPSQGRFTIEQSKDTQYDRFEIIEATGRKIHSGNLQSKTEVDLSTFTKGVYFIKLMGQENTDLRKIVFR